MNSAAELIPEKTLCRNMYWAGYSLSQISEIKYVNYNTLISWKNREKWDKSSTLQKMEGVLYTRYFLLLAKDNKTENEIKELEQLGKEMERYEKIKKFSETGNQANLNPRLSKRRKGKKIDQDKKNYLTEKQVSDLKKSFKNSLYPHQKKWHDAKVFDIRNILKSRQIGATWYFAREALIDAIETGDNQIFLSASKAQAHIFKEYITSFVYDVTGVQLKGDPIKLWNGATLYFLGTNSKTAQGYHGHLYLDEYFWINKFKEFQKVSSGMAMQKKWRETYFSTPSTTTHEAYEFWNGKHFNKGRPKTDHISVDVSHQALKDGMLCADGQWRQFVTAEDAVIQGYDLLDLDKLKLKYSEHDYNNLLMCQFVDDSFSVFTLKELQRCMVDSWVEWTDLQPLLDRPFGYREVWVGYDPSRTRDDASLVVVAPPLVDGGKFRILEKQSVNGMDFENQAKMIKAITERYNVTYIGIDTSGIGYGVFELVSKFFPAATPITYSVEVKNQMVLKTKNLVRTGRIEFDTGWNDLALAFMTIQKNITPTGRSISYQSARTDETGHADLAWATMHAINNQPFEYTDDESNSGSISSMEIF